MKTIKLPKIPWKNTNAQFFPKRTKAERQVNIDLGELVDEKKSEIIKARKRRVWLP